MRAIDGSIGHADGRDRKDGRPLRASATQRRRQTTTRATTRARFGRRAGARDRDLYISRIAIARSGFDRLGVDTRSERERMITANASAFSHPMIAIADDDRLGADARAPTMKRAASVAESIDELLAASPRARDVERERAESFSTHASSDRSSVDAFALAMRSPAMGGGDDRAARDAARGSDDRSRAHNGADYFTSFDSPPREVTLREVCALRASEGAIAPDGDGVLVDVCRGMLARERETHGAFVLDTTRALHVEYRAQLIEWVLDVCAGERFAPATADVAIALMVRDETRYLASEAKRTRTRGFFALRFLRACGFVCLCVLIEFVY